MKLKQIIRRVGSNIIRNVIPGGGLLVDTINAVLPPDKALAADATGAEMAGAIDGLPPELQASMLEKRYDVDLEFTKQEGKTRRAMLAAEANSKHTTRPRIAMGCFYVVAFLSVGITVTWIYAVLVHHHELVGEIHSGWAWVVALVAPFVTLLRLYFGDLRIEHSQRMDAARNATPRADSKGIIAQILGK